MKTKFPCSSEQGNHFRLNFPKLLDKSPYLWYNTHVWEIPDWGH